MLYLTDDLSPFFEPERNDRPTDLPSNSCAGQEAFEETRVQVRTCVSSKFAAKRLSKLTKHRFFMGAHRVYTLIEGEPR